MPTSDANTDDRLVLHQMATAMLYFGIGAVVIGSAQLFHAVSLFLSDAPLSAIASRGSLAFTLLLTGIAWGFCSTSFRKLGKMKSHSTDDLMVGMKTLSFTFAVLIVLASIRIAAQGITTVEFFLS